MKLGIPRTRTAQVPKGGNFPPSGLRGLLTPRGEPSSLRKARLERSPFALGEGLRRTFTLTSKDRVIPFGEGGHRGEQSFCGELPRTLDMFRGEVRSEVPSAGTNDVAEADRASLSSVGDNGPTCQLRVASEDGGKTVGTPCALDMFRGEGRGEAPSVETNDLADADRASAILSTLGANGPTCQLRVASEDGGKTVGTPCGLGDVLLPSLTSPGDLLLASLPAACQVFREAGIDPGTCKCVCASAGSD